jgi:hypothetical protein
VREDLLKSLYEQKNLRLFVLFHDVISFEYFLGLWFHIYDEFLYLLSAYFYLFLFLMHAVIFLLRTSGSEKTR